MGTDEKKVTSVELAMAEASRRGAGRGGGGEVEGLAQTYVEMRNRGMKSRNEEWE